MSEKKLYDKQSFIKIFNSIARHKHRYMVFSDFVTMSSIALHNGICKSESLENEYLEIVAKYSKDEVSCLCELFANCVELLNVEPRDVLGTLYMELDLGNNNNGQFFTPPDISLLLAELSYGDELKNLSKPFITLSEPACGSGGMVLAFVKKMMENDHNPIDKLWVQCIDVDRIAALMCYIQLSLWHVPAEIIVGNTLSLDFREVFYTPAHYLGNWEAKLRIQKESEAIKSLLDLESPSPPEKETVQTKIVVPAILEQVIKPIKKEEKKKGQIDLFDF